MNMEYKKWITFLAAILISGCSTPVSPVSQQTQLPAANLQWDASSAVPIGLSKAGFSANGTGIAIDGSQLTISKGGTYLLEGEMDNGQIIVDAKDAEIQLILNGVSLSCADSAPIYGKDGKITVILPEGTENSLTDTGEYSYPEGGDEPDAALFSKDDLTIGGPGALQINGKYSHGIACKDDLVITDGILSVTAKEDGIRGRDSLTVNGGNLSIEAGEDGLKSNNDQDADKGKIILTGGTLEIISGCDGIQAETLLDISDGNYQITAGGGSKDLHYEGEESCKGLKAGQEIKISGGQFNLDTLDDAIHSNGSIEINGGKFSVSTSDDGVHGENAVTISDGELLIAKCYEGVEGLNVTVSNGTLHITASDDGINAADPNAKQEGPGMGGMMGGHWGGNALPNGMPEPPEGMELPKEMPDRMEPPEEISQAGQQPSQEEPPSGTAQSQGTASNDKPLRNMGFPGGPGQRQINEEVYIKISGGTVMIDAQSDAFDSNGNLFLDGGTILLNTPGMGGDGALDCDGNCTLTGGILVAADNSDMVPGTQSTQPSLAIYFSQEQTAGTTVNLSTTDGNSIITFSPSKNFQHLVISTPELQEGQTVVLSTGGTDQLDGDGFAYQGTWSGGTKLAEITVSGSVTKVSEDGSEVTGMSRGMDGPSQRGRRNHQEAASSASTSAENS